MTKQVCAACGFVQKRRMIVCEQCGKPLVFPAKPDFTKPYSKKRPLVDPKVYQLAEWWMLAVNETDHAATDDEIWQLAGDIQTVCEDAARELEARQPKPKDNK